MQHFDVTIPEFLCIEVDYAILENAQDESAYMKSAVSIANVLVQNWFCLLAAREEATCLSRNEAPIYGLLIRATKLFHSFVLLTCNSESDGAFFLSRGIMDCLSDARYLIAHYEPDLIRDYIMLPFFAERDKLTQIRNLREQRNLLPIEERIVRGIEKDFIKSGITEEDLSQTSKNKNRWKKIGIEEKVKVHGYDQAYLFGQNTGNNMIHSNWTTLLSQHLIFVDKNQYKPRFESKPCRPQLILSLERLLCEAAVHFIGWAYPSKAVVERFSMQFADILGKVEKIDSLHEQYLNRKM